MGCNCTSLLLLCSVQKTPSDRASREKSKARSPFSTFYLRLSILSGDNFLLPIFISKHNIFQTSMSNILLTMKRSVIYFFLFFSIINASAFSQAVSINYDKSSKQETYAAMRLQEALKKKGYIVNANPAYAINFVIDAGVGAEAYTIVVIKNKITITGGDERGLIYGSLSLAEDISNGIAISRVASRNEKPHLALRAIKFDLPWDTYRHSYALDLHDKTCRDPQYWKAFLDMMAENRFNSLSL